MTDLAENAGCASASPSPTAAQRPMVLHARVVTGAGGGPDKTILNSPRFLRQRGFDCVCAYLRPPGDPGFDALRQRAVQWDAPLVEIDDRGPLDMRILGHLYRVCSEHHVDLWHAHDYKTNLLGVLLQRRRPTMRLVTTSHGWVERTWRTLIYHQLDRWSLRRYERVVAVSPDIAEVCAAWGVPSNKLAVIDNAIDVGAFTRRQATAAAKQELGWPANRLLVGAVGRLSPEKGFDLLIESVARLINLGRDVGLLIAGDGGERGRLEELIGRHGLSSRIRLVGFQQDLRPFYEACDVFALSSRREGLPNVVLEAMALELPVVATRIAGVPKLVADGQSGLLVEPGDAASFSAVLDELISSTERRRQFGEAGRRIVVERFSFDRRMDKVAALYREVLGGKDAATGDAA